jgi:cell division protein FtsZ
MIHFDLPKQKSSILKVIGVGGGGGNAVNHMYSQNIESVDFIICNTDAQALATSKVPNKIQLGPHLTQGLGAGANPEIGKQATEESLEEIRRILEVNTKMAFITAGMGGGTGTGGAPIIAKICKDLGVLTVGICTTPFTNEGPKRLAQAQKGINELREHVDTLLVISNDKLRHQYGNLKVREAFSKADDILATAARCITDVITSNGQINVDFADVCTVMRNGGVAILGSATAAGEDRAQRAIEEAVNSPLLNDSNISGAKWILVNITSSEGDYEITMDEEDVILSYLRQQAGENTDVIKGIGFDDTLGEKLGVTIIATGFDHKDPFKQAVTPKKEPVKAPEPEKIVMTLGVAGEEQKLYAPKEVVQPMQMEQMALPLEEKDPFAPTLMVEPTSHDRVEPVVEQKSELVTEENTILRFELSPEVPVQIVPTPSNLNEKAVQQEVVSSTPPSIPDVPKPYLNEVPPVQQEGSYILRRPSNIYAGPDYVKPSASDSMETTPPVPNHSDEPEFGMQLVVKDDVPEAADEAPAIQAQSASSPQLPVEEPAMQDDAEDQKRRAAERIQKLRNLSFNLNSADPNNEFETVPAYIRRNMELFGNNTLASVENFYSKVTVDKNDKDQSQISTINTFLDGKKPD